jgi:transcription initiation factor IIE alpha subunit
MMIKEVDSEGKFRCPKCNNVISPDDFSNMTYEILEAIMDKRNELVKIVVQCLVCKCDIVIVLK